jgi:hypothetical protein
MTHKFEELALDEHNYPTWAMDVKISLALRRMYEAIVPPTEENKHCLLHNSTMLYIL